LFVAESADAHIGLSRVAHITTQAWSEMAKKTPKPNNRMQAWIDARRRHGLSHAEVQMARELGMNPQKLGKLDNNDQEAWKMPLREFISTSISSDLGRNALTLSRQ
jgi:hypothetical protein